MLSLTVRSEGQSFNRKILIRAGYVTGSCYGTSEYTYNNGSFPKLLSNFDKTSGFRTSAIYLINDHIGAGLSFCSLSLRNWKCANLHDYDSSKASITSWIPVFYLQTPPLVKNIFTFFLQVGPSVSRVKTDLEYQVFYAKDLSGDPFSPVLSSKSINLGLDLSAGLLISVSEALGIYVAGSTGIIGARSVIYPDKTINNFTMEAGIKIRFLKDKRYYY